MRRLSDSRIAARDGLAHVGQLLVGGFVPVDGINGRGIDVVTWQSSKDHI